MPARLSVALSVGLLVGCSSEPLRLDCEAPANLHRADDRDALFGIPEDPVALLVTFHGLSETACNWVDHVEESRLVAAGVERGFAWVAVDGADRGWDVDLDSPEVPAVDAILADLEGEGVPPGLPILAVGHSNGGAFAQTYAVTSDRDVVAAVNANGWATAAMDADQSPPPMLFITAENDSVIAPRLVLEAAAAAHDRGHDVQTAYNTPTPLTAERLGRIATIAPEDAETILAAFEAANLLDSAGRPAVNPRTGAYAGALPERYEDVGSHVDQQVHVAFAEHRFNSVDSDAIFALFERALTER